MIYIKYKCFTYVICFFTLGKTQQSKFTTVIQNLVDTGCDEQFITKDIQLEKENKTNEQLRILGSYRFKLLDNLHKQQKKVDYLDQLIYNIRKRVTLNEIKY